MSFFVAPEEPAREKVITVDKPKRKPRKPKSTGRDPQKDSLLSEAQQAELEAKRAKLNELMDRIGPLTQIIDQTKAQIMKSEMPEFVMDISQDPVLMRAAKQIFKKKKTSINLADYKIIIEKIKVEQAAKIESYKLETDN